MATAVQPSFVLAITFYLASFAGLTALSAKVGTKLPAAPTWPFIVVTRLGGSLDHSGWVDSPRLQIDAWADTEKKADDAIAVVRAALLDMPGIRGAAVINYVQELAGPQALHEDVGGTTRYRFKVDFEATGHPVPA